MNARDQLRIQAYLDGELSPRESVQISEWLAKDAAARELEAELRTTHDLLAEHGEDAHVPVTREFYWSGIARAIAAEARPREEQAPRFAWGRWLRWLAPAVGIAALAFLAVLPMIDQTGRYGPRSHAAEPFDLITETPVEEMSSMTFQSEKDGITVVWVQNRPD